MRKVFVLLIMVLALICVSGFAFASPPPGNAHGQAAVIHSQSIDAVLNLHQVALAPAAVEIMATAAELRHYEAEHATRSQLIYRSCAIARARPATVRRT